MHFTADETTPRELTNGSTKLYTHQQEFVLISAMHPIHSKFRTKEIQNEPAGSLQEKNSDQVQNYMPINTIKNLYDSEVETQNNLARSSVSQHWPLVWCQPALRTTMSRGDASSWRGGSTRRLAPSARPT
jgi:hypothetical protein